MTNPLLILLYGIQETWPTASRFTASDIPDLAGKVFFITGGNAGIGMSIIYFVIVLYTTSKFDSDTPPFIIPPFK